MNRNNIHDNALLRLQFEGMVKHHGIEYAREHMQKDYGITV